MEIKFSIIIPLLNKEDTIKRTINSILAQTYANYEIIIVDGGSTDSSYDLVEQFQDQRIITLKQYDHGVSEARNLGISIATGEIIAFLDADDEWLPRHLETIVKLYQKYPKAGLYTTSYLLRYPDGKVIQPKYYHIPSAPFVGPIPNFFKTLFEGDPPVHVSTACIPREVFTDVGYFPAGEPIGEDIDMWGRIALKYDVVFDWTVGSFWHIGPKKPLYTQLEPFVNTAKQALEKSKVKDQYVEYIKRYIERKTLECATNNININNFLAARRILLNVTMKNYCLQKIFWLLISIFPQWSLPYLKKIKKLVI